MKEKAKNKKENKNTVKESGEKFFENAKGVKTDLRKVQIKGRAKKTREQYRKNKVIIKSFKNKFKCPVGIAGKCFEYDDNLTSVARALEKSLKVCLG